MQLDSLNPQQLSAVKKQLDEEVEHLSTSFSQLIAAQGKFRECLRCVKEKPRGKTAFRWPIQKQEDVARRLLPWKWTMLT